MNAGADPIFAAVEAFIALHESGSGAQPDEFASRYPAAQQNEIARQCRKFLEVDDWLGPALSDIPALHDTPVLKDIPATVTHSAASAPTAPPTDERRLGDYRILHEIGRGGMGVVFLAEQLSLQRKVALKVLSQGLSFSARHAERFRREAAAAARLQHSSIVPIYASGEIDGTLYYAMEFVDGPDLGDVIDNDRTANRIRSIVDTAKLTAQIARGIACAHEAGIVHRDIKPRNILIAPDGKPRILDFGLAKDLSRESMSLSGEMSGTPHYMSPEQTLAKRAPIDHRTDIFSLGVVLYELLTDRRPFDSDDLRQLVYQICFQEPTTIHKLNQQAPRDLVTICTKALEKDPATRYTTAAAMAEDLERFLRHEPILARPATPAARARKWVRRHRHLAATVSTLLTIAVVSVGWLWYNEAEAVARSNEILGKAEAAQMRGDHQLAAKLALGALQINNSERVTQAVKTIQAETQAEAVRSEYEIVTQAARAMKSDPDLALILALEASTRHPDHPHLANNTVLDALEARYDSILFEGHDRRVNRIVLNRNGDRVATASDDGSARIWDMSGNQLQNINASMNWVVAVTFSPDGKRLATTSVDNRSRVWDTATATLVCEYTGHDSRPMAIEFDTSGTRILTAEWGKRIDGQRAGKAHLWNAETGEAIAVFAGHEGKLQLATFSPDETRILTCAADTTARIWVTATGECLHILPGHENYISSGHWRPDGKQVVTGCKDGCARIFDAENGNLVATLRHSGKVGHASFSPDGTLVVTTSEDHTVRLWNSTNGFEVRVLTQHEGSVVTAAFDSTGLRLATASLDQTARLFEVATGQELAVLKHKHQDVRSVAFHPDGNTLVTHAGNDELRAWDISKSREVMVLRGHPDLVNHATFDATGERVATACQDGKVRIWDARGGHLMLTLPQSTAKFASTLPTAKFASFSPDGNTIVVAAGDRVQVFVLATGRVAHELHGHTRRVHSAVYSADGKTIVTAARDGRVRLYDAANGDLEREIDDCNDPDYASLSPNGQRLVICDDDPTVAVYERSSSRIIFRLRGHAEPTHYAAWSADGTRIITASGDGSAMLWDGQNGDLLRRFQGHESGVSSVDLTEDFALTASRDGTARLWNLATGEAWLTIDGHLDRVSHAEFSPDGTRVVTASHDGTVRLWPSDPVRTAKSFSLRPLTHAERKRYGMLTTMDIEASAFVDRLFDDKVLARDVKATLENDQSLDPKLKSLAAAIVDERGDPDPDQLHTRLRAQVMTASVDQSVVERVLRRAEALTRLKPKEPFFRGTVALALLRHGDHRDAIEAIQHSRELSEQAGRGTRLFHYAILAMAHHHLNEHDQTRAYFEELEAAMQTAKQRIREDDRRLYRETEALIRAK